MTSNDNTSESTKKAQQTQPEIAGAPGRSKIISVQGSDINKVINTQGTTSNGQAPNQQNNTPSVGNQSQQPPKQSIGGGGPEGPAVRVNVSSPPIQSLQPKPQGQQVQPQSQEVPDNDDINI